MATPRTLPLQQLIRTCLAGSLVVFAGCDDLRDWKTSPGEVYRGEVIGSDGNSDDDSFIRKGFVSHTWLELSFDPGSSDLVAQGSADAGLPRSAAGRVHTYVCPDGRADCDISERQAGPFVDAPLVTIDALVHDPLSQFTFPGGGRLQNYIFGLRFEAEVGGAKVGRDATVFVSLMENHRIEVRAMAPSVPLGETADERLPAMFGVFSLERAAQKTR